MRPGTPSLVGIDLSPGIIVLVVIVGRALLLSVGLAGG